MKKEKFQSLCEQVLIPRIGDFMYRHLNTIEETLDIFGREFGRIGERLDRIESQFGDHEDIR